MSLLKPIDKELNPCINKCCPNLKTCLGCGRNELERLEWASYSDSKKRRISKANNDHEKKTNIETNMLKMPG
ncbi:MAG: DUF1289 domain-containing protein [Betaproteobacteria bacterium]|nr:MAG: DUF1289 domain-containing protein [Bacteroidota bacterium]TDI83201.1 MAG: DUF1289 domain-containing protein [Betaproteobacteria bacterium]